MATKDPPVDAQRTHRYFSVHCFNHTWTLIEKEQRTPADDDAMVLAASASLWHWTQRADCTDQNHSIGHWQLSRVYALVREGRLALRHGRESLRWATGLSAFHVGYAHEAIARAARLLGDLALAREHLEKAQALAAQVALASDQALLAADLRALEGEAR